MLDSTYNSRRTSHRCSLVQILSVFQMKNWVSIRRKMIPKIPASLTARVGRLDWLSSVELSGESLNTMSSSGEVQKGLLLNPSCDKSFRYSLLLQSFFQWLCQRRNPSREIASLSCLMTSKLQTHILNSGIPWKVHTIYEYSSQSTNRV